jgi:hypothetical protein
MIDDGEWDQANTLMIASDKKEIMVDNFAESNANAAEIIEFAHTRGFQVHTESGKDIGVVAVKPIG